MSTEDMRQHFEPDGSPRRLDAGPAGADSLGRTGSGCLWKFDEWHCYYETACGNAYCFDDEFKPGKGYQYCPGCGKPITTSAAGKPDNEESSGQSGTTLSAPSSPNIPAQTPEGPQAP